MGITRCDFGGFSAIQEARNRFLPAFRCIDNLSDLDRRTYVDRLRADVIVRGVFSSLEDKCASYGRSLKKDLREVIDFTEQIYDELDRVGSAGQSLMEATSKWEASLILTIAKANAFANQTPKSSLPSLKTEFQVPVVKTVKERKILCGVQVITQDREPGLSENLELGKKIVQYVCERVLFSTNYPNRLTPCPLSQPKLSAILGHIGRAYRVEDSVELSEQIGVGNCYEMAIMGMQYPTPVPKEIFAIMDKDHMALVLGRNPSTNIRDPATWHSGVIVDPWANAYYPADRLPEFLMGYSGKCAADPNSTEINPFQPIVVPWEPGDELVPFSAPI